MSLQRSDENKPRSHPSDSALHNMPLLLSDIRAIYLVPSVNA
jgi:hypothetical protein